MTINPTMTLGALVKELHELAQFSSNRKKFIHWNVASLEQEKALGYCFKITLENGDERMTFYIGPEELKK